MPDWLFVHQPCIQAEVFGLHFCWMSNPKCMPYSHHRLSTCGLLIEVPMQLHLHYPCGFSACTKELMASLQLKTNIPDIQQRDIILLHFDKAQQIIPRGFSVPGQFQNGPRLLSLV